MRLTETAGLADTVLPLAEFREHLRLGSGFSEDQLQDGLLISHLRAALSNIERRTGKAVITRSFTLERECWQGDGGVRLPRGPVRVVDEVALIDAQGGVQPLDAGSWRLRADDEMPSVVPRSGRLPPVPAGGRLRIGFEAGYGPEWAAAPADLRQAVLMTAAALYEGRTPEGHLAGGVDWLIAPYGPMRLTGGGR